MTDKCHILTPFNILRQTMGLTVVYHGPSLDHIEYGVACAFYKLHYWQTTIKVTEKNNYKCFKYYLRVNIGIPIQLLFKVHISRDIKRIFF